MEGHPLMMLTDLAAACRKSGLKVVEVDGWRTRGHDEFYSLETIVCHHTAGPDGGGNYPSYNTVLHGRAGLDGPLAQLGLARNGTVYVFAAGVAWHAGATRRTECNNWHALGIEAEHNGVSPWPKAQVDAYARLCAALAEHYGIKQTHVLGHKEVCSPAGRKIDPNFSMSAFRKKVWRYRKHPKGATVKGPKVNRALVNRALRNMGHYNGKPVRRQRRVVVRALRRHGFTVKGFPKYKDAPVKRAIRKFQRKQGWTGNDANGFLGPETCRRLGVRSYWKDVPNHKPKKPKPKHKAKTPNLTKSLKALRAALRYSRKAGHSKRTRELQAVNKELTRVRRQVRNRRY